MLETKILLETGEILKAKNLLYKVYIQEMKWDFNKNNLSEINVLSSPLGPILEDQYGQDCIWLGTYLNERLISVARLIVDDLSKLEFTHYTNKFPASWNLKKCAEFNRFAIDYEYQKPEVMAFFIKDALNIAKGQKIELLISTVNFPNPGEFCLQLGFEHDPNNNFYYAKNDINEVGLVYLDLTNEVNYERINNVCSQIILSSK